jgi:hypothetical protein
VVGSVVVAQVHSPAPSFALGLALLWDVRVSRKMNAPEVVRPVPVWRPREIAIYLAAHVIPCRYAGIPPMSFDKWMKVCERGGYRMMLA